MKTRHFSFFSLATAYVLLTSASGIVGGVGCGGGGGSTTGTGGMGGMGDTTVVDSADLISDFEDLAAATVVMAGTPPRNGYWYTYNDDNPKGTDATCVQVPPSGPQLLPDPPATYVGEAPTSAPPVTNSATGPLPAGSLSLHAKWAGCSVWGAGIGADLGQPQVDGGTYSGPKVPYDIGAFKGVTFLAMAVVGTDTALRIKLPMTDETKMEDGGLCVESSTNKCSDDFGAKFNLPSNGTWKRITVRWADPTFIQEGWGAVFPWNPAHVTSIQIQSQNKTEAYDFYSDDMYFIK
jgi:hypothetical protein